MADRLVDSEANCRRIMNVEQCFGTSGQPLSAPNRILIGEGVLTKMCRKGPKPRQFFLFNDILVYGNIVISKKKYNQQHIMPLENITLKPVPDEGNLRNGWQIISPSKSFSIYAATPSEKTEWMSHIAKCAQDLVTKHGRKSTVADPSPVWVPDSDAPVCMHCRKSEFSILNRRHHCRRCGIVCCNTCAGKRWLLPHQSAKPLRVCLTCFYKLSSAPSSDLSTNTDGWAKPKYGNSSGEDSSDSDNESPPNGTPAAPEQVWDRLNGWEFNTPCIFSLDIQISREMALSSLRINTSFWS